MAYKVIQVISNRANIASAMETAIGLLSIKANTMPSTAIIADGNKILATITYEQA
jgi:hypothetical protein